MSGCFSKWISCIGLCRLLTCRGLLNSCKQPCEVERAQVCPPGSSKTGIKRYYYEVEKEDGQETFQIPFSVDLLPQTPLSIWALYIFRLQLLSPSHMKYMQYGGHY